MPKSKYPSAIGSSLYAQNLTAAITAATTADRAEVDLMAGGDWFVDAMVSYGVNEREEKLRLNPLLLEHARLIGDLRFQMVATTGSAQVFKAQPLDAKILTPNGWVLMGNLKVGDFIIAGDGSITTVSGIYPQGIKEVFNVVMSDGGSTQCCDDHLWLTQTHNDRGVNRCDTPLKSKGTRQRNWTPLPDGTRPGTVKKLSQIRDTLHRVDSKGELKYSRGKLRSCHSIPLVSSVDFVKAEELALDPYFLGLLIGDGSIKYGSIGFSSVDAEIIESIRSVLPENHEIFARSKETSNCDYGIRTNLKGYHLRTQGNEIRNALIDLGLQGKGSYDKFVPDSYKYGDKPTRLAVLQGLMDTDGSVSKNNTLTFGSSSERLALDVRDLVLSLGGLPNELQIRETWYTYKGEKRDGQLAYYFTFRLPNEIRPFRLKRKLDRCFDKEDRKMNRFIREIIPAGEKEVQCISIDHPSKLYVTDDYIVTHNTLNHWQLTAAILTIAQRDFMWVYPQATMIAALVPTGFKPIIAAWEIALGLERKSAPTDSKSQKIHQSALGTGRFVAASNPSASRKQMEGMAAAGAGGVAASTDILFMEEASQVQESLLEPFDRRLLQSRLATIPKRKLGTPGSGGGIERDVERAKWSFYPHTTCRNCGETSALSPLGWLLKPNAEGEYFDESGIPHRSQFEAFWHHHDPSNPIETAYFGCPNCGTEIDTNQRINESWFQCLKSGDKLSDVLDNIPHGVPKTPLTAGITLSPLIRDSNRNEAYLIIDKGIKTGNAIDWQQQEIGIPTTVANNGITIDMIRRAVNSFSPPRKIDCTFWGLDQGTKEHWICAIHYRYPEDWRLEPIERYRLAHREFAFIQPCTTDDIPNLIMRCHGGCLDNEPGRDWAAEICDTYPGVFMADQRGGKELGGQTVKMGKVFAGGREREAMFVDTHQMQNYILDYFAAKEQRVRMPRTIDPDDLGKSSVSRHLTTSPRDPNTGRWSRPKDNNDDMLKAIVFAETAFFCYTLGIQNPSYSGMNGIA